ncbi:MAG: DUF1841 family protein [Woeseiaceae bacterium]
MIFGQDRNELRRMYAEAWRKRTEEQALTPLEAQIAAVIEEHPEYQSALDGDLDKDFTVAGGETNPFLHMGLHLGIREQVATNRPAGIRAVFDELAARLGDAHDAEHQMIDCLAEAIWTAQREQRPPDELQYLESLRKL